MISSTLGTLLSTQVGGATIVTANGKIDRNLNASGTGSKSTSGQIFSNLTLAASEGVLASSTGGTYVFITGVTGANASGPGGYSIDGGNTWVSLTGPTGNWNAMTFSPTINRFLTISQASDSTVTTGTAAYNDGGTGSWTTYQLNPSGMTGAPYFFAVRWLNDRFIAAGAKTDLTAVNPSIITSVTGTTAGQWEAYSVPSTHRYTQFRDVAYGNGVYVAVGQTGNDRVVISSTDTITWTGRTGPTGGTSPAGYNAVDWSPRGEFFLATGGGDINKMIKSTDGVNWITQSYSGDAGSENGFINLRWSNEFARFFGSTLNDGMYSSPDGNYWVKVLDRSMQNIATAQYDPDASDFMRMSGITGTDATAINTLVLDLKRANLWTALTAIYPFVGSTSSTQKWNLRYPIDSNDYLRLTFSGGWSHSANGALANGTNAFANTNLGTQSCSTVNWACSVYIRNNYTPAAAAVDIGAYDENANYGTFIAAQLSIGTARARAWQTAMDFSTTDERGMWLVTSNGTTGSFYLNGNLVASSAQSGSLPNNPTISIGALNRVSGGNAYYSAAEYAFATLGPALTAQQTANLYNIVQKYQTNLGRQV